MSHQVLLKKTCSIDILIFIFKILFEILEPFDSKWTYLNLPLNIKKITGKIKCYGSSSFSQHRLAINFTILDPKF